MLDDLALSGDKFFFTYDQGGEKCFGYSAINNLDRAEFAKGKFNVACALPDGAACYVSCADVYSTHRIIRARLYFTVLHNIEKSLSFYTLDEALSEKTGLSLYDFVTQHDDYYVLQIFAVVLVNLGYSVTLTVNGDALSVNKISEDK
jgi:hypothetical protein